LGRQAFFAETIYVDFCHVAGKKKIRTMRAERQKLVASFSMESASGGAQLDEFRRLAPRVAAV
jgi:hypothetical protein